MAKNSLQKVRLYKNSLLPILKVLEEGGWCKYTSMNEKGNHCLYGAYEEALKRLGNPLDLRNGLYKQLKARVKLYVDHYDIVRFNDDHEIDETDICMVLTMEDVEYTDQYSGVPRENS